MTRERVAGRGAGQLHPAAAAAILSPSSCPSTHSVFPDGLSVLKQFFKTVKLREACFRDVIVLYRLAVPDTPVGAGRAGTAMLASALH